MTVTVGSPQYKALAREYAYWERMEREGRLRESDAARKKQVDALMTEAELAHVVNDVQPESEGQ